MSSVQNKNIKFISTLTYMDTNNELSKLKPSKIQRKGSEGIIILLHKIYKNNSK